MRFAALLGAAAAASVAGAWAGAERARRLHAGRLNLAPEAVQWFCDRNFGIGGDGVILVRPATVEGADLVLTVRRPSSELTSDLPKGTVIAGQLDPYGDRADAERGPLA